MPSLALTIFFNDLLLFFSSVKNKICFFVGLVWGKAVCRCSFSFHFLTLTRMSLPFKHDELGNLLELTSFCLFLHDLGPDRQTDIGRHQVKRDVYRHCLTHFSTIYVVWWWFTSTKWRSCPLTRQGKKLVLFFLSPLLTLNCFIQFLHYFGLIWFYNMSWMPRISSSSDDLTELVKSVFLLTFPFSRLLTN